MFWQEGMHVICNPSQIFEWYIWISSHSFLLDTSLTNWTVSPRDHVVTSFDHLASWAVRRSQFFCIKNILLYNLVLTSNQTLTVACFEMKIKSKSNHFQVVLVGHSQRVFSIPMTCERHQEKFQTCWPNRISLSSM